MSPFGQKLFKAVQANDAAVFLEAFRKNRATSSTQHLDSEGNGWLHWAASRGSLGFLKVILESQTLWPFDGVNGDGNSPLDEAIRVQRSRSVLHLLITHGANPSLITGGASFFQGTPLHMAVAYHPESIPFLVQQGADVETCNHDGLNPVMAAAALGQMTSLEHLMAHGANVHTQIVDSPRTVSRAGMTALHLAMIKEKNAPMVQRLLDLGVDPEILDARDRTPLMMSEAKIDNMAVLESHFLQRFADLLNDEAPILKEPKRERL